MKKNHWNLQNRIYYVCGGIKKKTECFNGDIKKRKRKISAHKDAAQLL